MQNSSVNGTRTTYVYDAADQLTSSDASTSSSRTVTTFTYDASGNLLTEKENGTVKVTNTWDDENRRTKVQLVSGGPGDYAYNADGQRVVKTIAGTQTRLVWDGEAYLMELDSSNVTSAVYTVAPSAFGMLIAQRRKSGAVWTPSYYLFDALGSTDRLLSAAQAVTDSYVYRAFGELAASTGSTTNPFRWVGELGYYYDPVGTQSDYYVRARWYKPAIARWLSQDPLGFDAGDWNLFRYVLNRLVLLHDASGMAPKETPNTTDPKVDTCNKKFPGVELKPADPTKLPGQSLEALLKCLEKKGAKGKDRKLPTILAECMAEVFGKPIGGKPGSIADYICCLVNTNSTRPGDPCQCGAIDDNAGTKGPCWSPQSKDRYVGTPGQCQECCDFLACKCSWGIVEGIIFGGGKIPPPGDMARKAVKCEQGLNKCYAACDANCTKQNG